MTTKSIVESPWAEDMGQFLYHLNPDTRKITRSLVKAKLKIIKKQCSRVFNKICLNNNNLLTLQYTYKPIEIEINLPRFQLT